jgi:hypothetical protein
VSHIDDDHIHGLLDLTDELLGDEDRGTAPWLDTKALWHNSFGELTGDGDGAAVAALASDDSAQTLSEDASADVGLRQSAAVVASVGQGRRLRDEAERLGWTINAPFAELVAAPENGGRLVNFDDGLSLLVVAPRTDQVDKLRKEWVEQLERLQKKEADPAAVAAYLDQSPYNLSSIVCLAKHGERTVLLTGDARGDHILDALEVAGAMKDRKLHVDVLKLPHHGSIRNVDPDFFERITADHYVISSDGRNGNPETETLELIADSREDDDWAIHLTYASGVGDLGSRLEDFTERYQAEGREFEVNVRDDASLSLRIDLLDPLPD